MKYFIYSKPLVSTRKNNFIGTLILVSKDILDIEEYSRRIVVIGTEEEYNRLSRMMNLSKSSLDDSWCVLDDKRTEKDLIGIIKQWRKTK